MPRLHKEPQQNRLLFDSFDCRAEAAVGERGRSLWLALVRSEQSEYLLNASEAVVGDTAKL